MDVEQVSLALVLKSYCPKGFRYNPSPIQLDQITELPLQQATKFGKGVLTSHSFDGGMHLKPAGQELSRDKVGDP